LAISSWLLAVFYHVFIFSIELLVLRIEKLLSANIYYSSFLYLQESILFFSFEKISHLFLFQSTSRYKILKKNFTRSDVFGY